MATKRRPSFEEAATVGSGPRGGLRPETAEMPPSTGGSPSVIGGPPPTGARGPDPLTVRLGPREPRGGHAFARLSATRSDLPIMAEMLDRERAVARQWGVDHGADPVTTRLASDGRRQLLVVPDWAALVAARDVTAVGFFGQLRRGSTTPSSSTSRPRWPKRSPASRSSGCSATTTSAPSMGASATSSSSRGPTDPSSGTPIRRTAKRSASPRRTTSRSASIGASCRALSRARRNSPSSARATSTFAARGPGGPSASIAEAGPGGPAGTRPAAPRPRDGKVSRRLAVRTAGRGPRDRRSAARRRRSRPSRRPSAISCGPRRAARNGGEQPILAEQLAGSTRLGDAVGVEHEAVAGRERHVGVDVVAVEAAERHAEARPAAGSRPRRRPPAADGRRSSRWRGRSPCRGRAERRSRTLAASRAAAAAGWSCAG